MILHVDPTALTETARPLRSAAAAVSSAVADRAETLATALDTAAAGYAEAEERTRRQAAAGADGGPA